MPNNSGTINGWPTTISSQTKKLLQAFCDDEVVTFFEQLGLSNGWRQYLVGAMLNKLHEAAVAKGLTPGFDPDNQPMLMKLIEAMNFKPNKKPKLK